MYLSGSGFETGFVNFEEMCGGTCGDVSDCDGTCVSGNFWGLVDGLAPGDPSGFGLHINEFGALNSGIGCDGETGSIFNPSGSAYGLPDPMTPYPMGALGNVYSAAVSTGLFGVSQCAAQEYHYCAPIGSIDLSQGPNGIMNRSVVLRASEDEGLNDSAPSPSTFIKACGRITETWIDPNIDLLPLDATVDGNQMGAGAIPCIIPA